MKKKEILIIFVLAVLATGGSWFYTPSSQDCWSRGYPLRFWYYCAPWFLHDLPKVIWMTSSFILDFLFWFLVLAGGWWMVKKKLAI